MGNNQSKNGLPEKLTPSVVLCASNSASSFGPHVMGLQIGSPNGLVCSTDLGGLHGASTDFDGLMKLAHAVMVNESTKSCYVTMRITDNSLPASALAAALDRITNSAKQQLASDEVLVIVLLPPLEVTPN